MAETRHRTPRLANDTPARPREKRPSRASHQQSEESPMSTPQIDESGSRQTSEIFGRPSIDGVAARAYLHYLERGGVNRRSAKDLRCLSRT